MINTQPIEKRVTRQDGMLDVHSVFETIQGEGPFCGTPCVFIRLAGCNLQCPACDTDYTNGRNHYFPTEIVDMVRAKRTGGLVVITGGEPFRQPFAPLVRLLHEAGYFIQIESNGTLEVPNILDIPWSLHVENRRGCYLVISPKTGKVHYTALERACALKYVVEYDQIDPDDGLPLHALQHVGRPARPPEGWNRLIYVQPMDSKDSVVNQTNLEGAIASCMKHGYILQLQIHKYIGVE